MYSDGDKLPTESDLADRFSVSRPVVREALAQLRDDNLINVRRGSGSYVIKRPSAAVLKFAPLGSIADIQRCFEFRETIEPKAAALAAQRRSEEELDRLHNALKDLEDAASDGKLGAAADFAFHLAISQASGNAFFEATMGSLESAAAAAIAVNRSLSLMRPSDRLAVVQREHEDIFKMIRVMDSEGAAASMRSHIEGARKRMFDGEA